MGYVVGGTTLVGNWRIMEHPNEPVTFEGAWVMSKRTEWWCWVFSLSSFLARLARSPFFFCCRDPHRLWSGIVYTITYILAYNAYIPTWHIIHHPHHIGIYIHTYSIPSVSSYIIYATTFESLHTYCTYRSMYLVYICIIHVPNACCFFYDFYSNSCVVRLCPKVVARQVVVSTVMINVCIHNNLLMPSDEHT